MPSPTFDEIRLLEVRESTADPAGAEPSETHRTVREKIEDYLLVSRCSTAHTQGILLQLLTVGKVRVAFRDYSERLQLLAPEQRMERAEAIIQLEEAFAGFFRQKQTEQDADLTQKIIIQPPKGGGYLRAD
jgi:hypothetical protein